MKIVSKSSIEWYFRGLFVHPISEVLLILIIFSQYEVLSSQLGSSALSTVTVFIFAPLYGIVTGAHFLRDSQATIFELALIKSRSGLILSKLIVLLVGYLPLVLLEIATFAYFQEYLYIWTIIVTVLSYTSFTIASSLIPDNKGAIISVTSFLFLIPFSMSAAAASLQSSGSTNLFLSVLAYIFSPFYASTVPDTFSIQISVGLIVSIVISLSLITVSIRLFDKMDLSP